VVLEDSGSISVVDFKDLASNSLGRFNVALGTGVEGDGFSNVTIHVYEIMLENMKFE